MLAVPVPDIVQIFWSSSIVLDQIQAGLLVDVP